MTNQRKAMLAALIGNVIFAIESAVFIIITLIQTKGNESFGLIQMLGSVMIIIGGI